MSIGLIGIKTGMTRVFDDSGVSIPVTVINIDSNRISQIKTKERDGYSAIQVAYGSQKESRLSKALLGHYTKSNIKPAIKKNWPCKKNYCKKVYWAAGNKKFY